MTYHETMKKIVRFLILLLLPLVFLYLLNSFFSHSIKTPKAQQGVLDLSGWNLEEDGVVPLDGEWEFYWNQLLTYQDFHNGSSQKKNYGAVPSTWDSYENNLPGTGYATYRLKIKAINSSSIYGLKIKNMFTPYKLMVNDKVVAANGVVGKNPESYFPEYKPLSSFFNADKNGFEIILQVANFTYARGGPGYSIYLGTDHQIIVLQEKSRQKDIFLLGTIFIMALYHTAIFLVQRKYHYKAELYFVAFMVLFFVNIAFRGEYVILNVFPSLSIYWLIVFQYTANYWAAAALALFMQELYPEECSGWVSKILVVNSSLLTLITLLTPIAFFTRFTLYLQIQLIIVALYYTYIAWLAVIRNRVGAALLFSTFIFSIGAFILESLNHWNLYSNKYAELFPSVSLILIFVQAFILAQRFSASFSAVNILTQKLLSLDELKDEFIANTSHELRTPLHGMITITESVLESTAGILPQKQKENLNLVVSSGKINDIFKSFEQLDMALTGQYGSRGLGLSITKYLVETHGGSIWATSEPGKGSTFTFSMPISSTIDHKSSEQKLRSYTSLPQTTFKNPAILKQNGDFTVLLVDNDYANLQALINILTVENYSSIAVANGNEALEVLNQNKNIDLVILDIMLPDMSGYEVCRKIRENYSLFELPVLMMTAKNSANSMLPGFTAGCNDFLNKPFNSSELKARMKTLLQLKKSVSQTIQNEMAFLQAQIKPHFLYNALNTIMSFCWTDAERAGQLLLALSSYLRGSFNFNNMNQFSTLEQELEFVESYVTIEKARFEEKLNFQYDIAIPPENIMIPNLVIQPIVENAIKHGILPKREGGTIIISVKQEETYILITIRDDGVGISQEKLSHLLTSSQNKGVGVINVDRRLKRIYGHGIQITSGVDVGTTVSIKIPDVRKGV